MLPASQLAAGALQEVQSQPSIPHERSPRKPWTKVRRVSAAMPAVQVIHNGFQSIQVNVDERGSNILADAGNEPSIAIDPTEPRKMLIGWRQFDDVTSDFRQAGYGYSQDSGRSWVFPGSLTPGVFGSDPVLAGNRQKGVIYYLSVNREELRLFRSNDCGITWNDPVQVLDTFADKPWMSIDTTDGVGSGNIYISWVQSDIVRSTDHGKTFLRFDNSEACGPWFGDFGTNTVGPGGELYVIGPAGIRFPDGTATTGLLGAKSVNAKKASEEPRFLYGLALAIS